MHRSTAIKTISIQECIPVGCVPAARRPYAGVCFPGGGVCLVWGGFSIRGGSSIRGGFLHPGGGSPSRGGYGIPACTEADTLPPCGQTHTCKNITLATTSLRPVITSRSLTQLNCASGIISEFVAL